MDRRICNLLVWGRPSLTTIGRYMYWCQAFPTYIMIASVDDGISQTHILGLQWLQNEPGYLCQVQTCHWPATLRHEVRKVGSGDPRQPSWISGCVTAVSRNFGGKERRGKVRKNKPEKKVLMRLELSYLLAGLLSCGFWSLRFPGDLDRDKLKAVYWGRQALYFFIFY